MISTHSWFPTSRKSTFNHWHCIYVKFHSRFRLPRQTLATFFENSATPSSITRSESMHSFWSLATEAIRVHTSRFRASLTSMFLCSRWLCWQRTINQHSFCLPLWVDHKSNAFASCFNTYCELCEEFVFDYVRDDNPLIVTVECSLEHYAWYSLLCLNR